MLEIKGKFPSSEMIHKLAAALCIDPTELFFKELDPKIVMKNSQRAAIEDISEGVSQILSDFFTKRISLYAADEQQTPPQDPGDSTR
jgi:hypothetical protein